MGEQKKPLKHVVLTSHPGSSDKKPMPLKWGAETPAERGPVIASITRSEHRNVIGTHSGSYMVYRALAVAAGELDPEHKPDLTNTAPVASLGPFDSWKTNDKIVSIDPWGARVATDFADLINQGVDIRPTIAVTQAHMNILELQDAIRKGRLHPDGKILLDNGAVVVTKAAVEPVWHLPGIARRFKVDEGEMRLSLFEYTGGMYPELVTRPDLEIFLPPIGGLTAYLFGDIKRMQNKKSGLTCRVHDECNGSDVFGSDICTCRPYLIHGIEECIKGAQQGGSGLIVYNRKEGRALGEVTKFLVYNARKRQEGGDTADKYFERTECVAGVQDMRFQELMPDILHWFGIEVIDRFISMSDMKHDAIVGSGIRISQRVSIPDNLIPDDAKVEMDAKKAAGYFTEGEKPDAKELKNPKGRNIT